MLACLLALAMFALAMFALFASRDSMRACLLEPLMCGCLTPVTLCCFVEDHPLGTRDVLSAPRLRAPSDNFSNDGVTAGLLLC